MMLELQSWPPFCWYNESSQRSNPSGMWAYQILAQVCSSQPGYKKRALKDAARWFHCNRSTNLMPKTNSNTLLSTSGQKASSSKENLAASGSFLLVSLQMFIHSSEGCLWLVDQDFWGNLPQGRLEVRWFGSWLIAWGPSSPRRNAARVDLVTTTSICFTWMCSGRDSHEESYTRSSGRDEGTGCGHGMAVQR